MTIKEQLAKLEATRAAKAARMNEIMQKSVDDGRTTDAAEAEEVDTITDEIKKIDSDIVRLKNMEALNLEAAVAVRGNNPEEADRSRNLATVKTVEKLAPGIAFARHAMCVFAAKGNMMEAASLARTHYGENSPVARALAFSGGRSMENIIKAAIAGGTSTDATWAAPLIEYINYAGDFVTFLRPKTLLGQFGLGNVPDLRRIPFNVHIKGQTAGGTGYWVGEGKPIPATKFGYNSAYHGWFKVAGLAVLTEDLIRFSDPSAETYVRDSLADCLVERMDTDFINPSFAGVANVSPASITNGIAAIVSTGNDADHVRTDLMALWAAADAASHNFDSPVYLMRESTARALGNMVNALGQPEFPGIGPKGGTLGMVPVLVSNYVTSDSNGPFVVLVNASDIYLSDDGQATVDFSTEASIQMLDNPTNDAGVGTATTMVSMFQTDSVALRARRFLNWSRRRNTAVAVLAHVHWGT
jgi:hypothetical protein